MILNKTFLHRALCGHFNRNESRIFIKLYSSIAKELLTQNNIEQAAIRVPKINHARNQRRITSTHSVIGLWLATSLTREQQHYTSFTSRLIYKLEMMAFEKPNEYIDLCKQHSIWMRNNQLLDPNERGILDHKYWSFGVKCPALFGDLIFEHDIKDLSKIDRILYIGILSIFEAYHVILHPVAPNLKTIVEPYTGIENPIREDEMVSAFINLGIDIPKFREDLLKANAQDDGHVSSSNGPNGQSLGMSHIDAKAVGKDKNLKENLREFSELNNRLDVMEKLEDTIRLPNFFKVEQSSPKHSKLHIIHEKGNKARVIAILDYGSQELLSPLHDTLASILRGLEQDCTFDQTRGCETVKKYTNNPDISLFSLDLSAATDRLPRAIQVNVLTALTGSMEYSKSGEAVISDRDFQLLDNEQGKLRYAVGQPMGAKSSFPMLGLTHHILLNIASQRAGKPHFKEYVILGDDIVIADESIKDEYVTLMKNIGMVIVEAKSIYSVHGKGNTIAEFCKRLFVNGKSYTPLPNKLIATTIEYQDLSYQLQEELGKRDLIINKNILDNFMAGLVREKPFKELAFLNGLPRGMTGMKYSVPNPSMEYLDHKNGEKTLKLTEQTLQSFFTYTVVTEQLKRLNVILQNTESVYKTIVKAADVSKTIGIGKPEEGYLPVEEFTDDILEEGDVVNVFHPATKAVISEVNRINLLIMQMANADIDMLQALRSQLVDSLKISSYETNPEVRIVDQRVSRRLIDETFRNLAKSARSPSKSLVFSIKLARLNMIWNVKTAFDSPCLISRSTTKIASFAIEAKRRLESYTAKKDIDILSEFIKK